jgi:hypothetical protein
LLTRSDVILESRTGFTVWYPANGLAFAVMLGVSPWYGPLVVIADLLSLVMFDHQRLFSWSLALDPLGIAAYAAAALILRRRWRIDFNLTHRRDVVRYAVGALTAAACSTVAGVAALLADHAITWNQFWLSAFVCTAVTR